MKGNSKLGMSTNNNCLSDPVLEKRGWSALEVIGVMAGMAVLIALLAPKVIGAIDDARLAYDVGNVKNIRSATETYFQSYHQFEGVKGAPVAFTNNTCDDWDSKVLLAERLLDSPLRSKLASRAYVRVSIATNANIDPLTWGNYGSLGNQLANNTAYDLLQEYAWATPSNPDGPLFATVSGRLRGGSVAGALAGNGFISAEARPIGARAHATVTGIAGSFARNLLAGGLRPSMLLWPGLGKGSGLGPIEGLIQFVPRWPIGGGVPPPPPSPPVGGGTGSGNPSHTSSPTPLNNNAGSSHVVEVVLQNVSLEDAYRLSLAIDGPSQSNWAYWDSQGRVKYDFGNIKTGTVFVFIAAK